MVPVVALFLRNRPSDLGLRAFGATEADTVPTNTGSPIANAFRGLRMGVRSRDFWLLGGSFFICGASTNGLIGTHLIPASMDHGMAEVTAASLLAVIGVFDVIGTLASGYLTDRFDSRWLLFFYYGLRGLSLLFRPYGRLSATSSRRGSGLGLHIAKSIVEAHGGSLRLEPHSEEGAEPKGTTFSFDLPLP